ncbi:MAG: hypothetical protein HYV16_01645 [Gammaproteobacteria bacterium]|nr:hypothetical protein [Gammaproteobacteria bacterium]
MTKKSHSLTGLITASLLSAALVPVLASANPFSMTDLAQGYNLAAAGDEGQMKGKEGQCGADKMSKEEHKTMKEGKCGEGKCGADKKAMKSDKEGQCGADKKAMKADKEGQCGADKKPQ